MNKDLQECLRLASEIASMVKIERERTPTGMKLRLSLKDGNETETGLLQKVGQGLIGNAPKRLR